MQYELLSGTNISTNNYSSFNIVRLLTSGRHAAPMTLVVIFAQDNKVNFLQNWSKVHERIMTSFLRPIMKAVILKTRKRKKLTLSFVKAKEQWQAFS